MTIKTHLSPIATPGKRYSFSSRVEAGIEHTGDFTTLSPLAIPGKRFTFFSKTPAPAPAVQVTALTVTALPGGVQTFTAKTAVLQPEAGIGLYIVPRGLSKVKERVKKGKILKQILQEDEEMLTVIMAFVTEG